MKAKKLIDFRTLFNSHFSLIKAPKVFKISIGRLHHLSICLHGLCYIINIAMAYVLDERKFTKLLKAPIGILHKVLIDDATYIDDSFT